MANKGHFTIGLTSATIRGDSTDNVFLGSPRSERIEGLAGHDFIGLAPQNNSTSFSVYQTATAKSAGATTTLTFVYQPSLLREFWIDAAGASAEGRYEIRVLDSSNRVVGSFSGILSASDQMNLQGKPMDRWGFESILSAGQTYRIQVLDTYLDPNTGKRRSTVFVPRLQYVDIVEGDYLYGGDGNDTIHGTIAPDYISGGNGQDFIHGNHGNDTIDAGEGYNWVDGGSGHDWIEAGSGDDTLLGGDGSDTILGGLGNDTLYGMSGNDILKGGQGADTLLGGAGSDKIYGESGNDRMEGGTGEDWLDGGEGSDFILGEGGNDTLLGGDGSDTFRGDNGNDSIRGGTGSDRIEGGAGNDSLYGDTDHDSIKGDSGNDWIDGGSGNDTLSGDIGNDTLLGEGGDDVLLGASGNDSLRGGSGNDVLRGGTGDDFLVGEGGRDSIRGDVGNDTLDGGSSEDTLFGDDGNDSLRGGNSADFLRGGKGKDTLYGDADHDTLWGDEDDDFLSGGSGNDLLYGGVGRDTVRGGIGRDTIEGGTGNDSIDGEDEKDLIRGGSGNDWITGGMGHDVLYGDAGNDTISGGANEDTIYGGSEHDKLYGNSGLDVLYGELGNDSIYGGDHKDYLYGQSGNDLLDGGEGNDWLEGGQGQDTLYGGNGNDTLRGSLNFLSKNEIDFLYGGGGDDIFVLGTDKGTFYSDGTTGPGKGDYAYIHDFTVGRDRLRLFGSRSDYYTTSATVGKTAGRSLFFDSNRNGKFDSDDERIAFLKGGQGWNVNQIFGNAQFMGGIMPGVNRPDPFTSMIPLSFRAAVDDGERWKKTKLTFNFRTYNVANITTESSIYRLSDFAQQAVRRVFANLQSFTNLVFEEVASGIADLQLISANLPSGTAGWAYGPDQSDGSLIVISNNYNDLDYRSQNKAFSTLMHEIGHALGLEHPHEGGIRLPASYDTKDYTVMSYNNAVQALENELFRDLGFSDSYQIFDVATLQAKYGANRTLTGGDTRHLINSHEQVRKTIWDGGGTSDWLIVEGNPYGGASIHLSEGPQHLSVIGLSRVWIAYGSNIENAQGSNEADQIYGNQLDNHLIGGAGADRLQGAELSRAGRWEQDTLTGGSGPDRFVLGSAAVRFYDDLKPTSNGIADFAVITDFNPSEDGLDLKGHRSQYHLTSAANFGVSGKALYHDSNLNKLYDDRDELIAIVQSQQVLNFANTLGTASNAQYL